ncbi:hypothetical protein FHE72_16025 [Rossellomorea vietnamensis]|uniref:Uncharacterized protein n=1 Tax=Rossellomorea vietnamensis TaxID=218284 RepID=A0A6I6UHD5_9BACI|nr:hypothetical protein [Rossellomorea vietnamensis]QHE62354.1 hypothetical protein FHE72_16025 [Rossellomorea vietnamensis]
MIYLFSLLALILLLPILYFIPIGISHGGKLLIAGVSFGLTLLGLVASAQYPMWLIGLVLLALLAILSYVMEQRFSGLLVVAAGHDQDVKEEQWHETPANVEFEFKSDLHSDKEVSNEVSEVKDVEEIASVEESVNEIESEDHNQEDMVLRKETLETFEDIEPLQEQEEVMPVHVVQETASTQVQEDESEWFIENANELNEEPDVTEEDFELFEGDLSEIESMINDPEEIAVEETEETEVYMEELAEIIDESDEPVFEEIEEPVSAGEEAVLEDSIDGEDELIDHNRAEDDAFIDQLPMRSRIMREVMKTMIEQITLSRSLLSDDQMENMIKHYLHPSLHDQDYYTFARMLMDHYISTKQYKDLNMFIKGIEERFREYPYIIMDIDQTKEYAWEMTRN